MELSLVTFGDRVAENEAAQLASYFVRTDDWTQLRAGKIDVVFGAKGAGKSALYTLLNQEAENFEASGILLMSAEKPTGQTVFSEIRNEPPTSEAEFVGLWKIYICQLIIEALVQRGRCTGEAEFVRQKLVEAELIEERNSLKRFVNSAMRFARKAFSIESVEGGGSIAGDVTEKMTIRKLDNANRTREYF